MENVGSNPTITPLFFFPHWQRAVFSIYVLPSLIWKKCETKCVRLGGIKKCNTRGSNFVVNLFLKQEVTTGNRTLYHLAMDFYQVGIKAYRDICGMARVDSNGCTSLCLNTWDEGGKIGSGEVEWKTNENQFPRYLVGKYFLVKHLRCLKSRSIFR